MPNDIPTKAFIMRLDKPSEHITCLFNPKEYSLSKSNEWKFNTIATQNVPSAVFGGGDSATIQMQLMFDTYTSKKDVRKEYTDKIWELMLIRDESRDPETKKGLPPIVRFQWGEGSPKWSFNAVITKLSQQFTLFHSDGTPLRATLDVTFVQVTDPETQPNTNPTSGGVGGERVWRVSAGDTLAWIAYKELGSSGAWRRIAEANSLTQVRRLVPGTMLVIPK